MTDSIHVDDLIALREDIPEHDLKRGRVGMIVKMITWKEVEVEFQNEQFRSIATVPLKLEQIQILRHETTLDDKLFWQLIEDAKAQSEGKTERQVQLLIAMLAERSIADIYAFGMLTRKYMWFAFRSDLWAAAYIIEGLITTDSAFVDFRSWLLTQGEKVYYDALQNPETLVDVIDAECLHGWMHGVLSIGIEFVDNDAYEKKTGQTMHYPPGTPDISKLVGPDWDEESALRMYPKLAAKFGIGECEED